MSTSEEQANMKLVYEYIKLNKNRLPDYWQDKGASSCIEGMCCMIARNKHTDEAIAEFYECPVPLVKQVKIAYKKTIAMMEKQRDEMMDAFGNLCFENDIENITDDSCVRLVCAIFKRYNNED